jgi:hypothetical protein
LNPVSLSSPAWHSPMFERRKSCVAGERDETGSFYGLIGKPASVRVMRR